MTSADRHNSLIVIMVTIAVTGIGWGLSSPILALMMEDAGYSRTIIGLNTAMGAVATLAYTPLAPNLMRRIGVRETLIAGLLLAMITVVGFKLTDSITLWFILRFLFGVALAALFVATEVWINSVAEERSRGRVLGIYATCLSGGFAIGVGILSVQGSGTWAPFLTAASLLAAALVVLLLVPAQVPRLSQSRQEGALLPPMLAAPAAMGAGLVFGAVEMGILNLLPVYGERAGLAEADAVRMLMAAAAGNVALQFPIGWLADKMDRRLVLALCAFSGLAGAILVPFAIGIDWLVYIILFITGGVIVGLYTVGLVLIGERFTGSALAGANAAFIMMYGVGSLVGPGVSGVAMDIWDPHGLMVILGSTCAVYMVLVLIRRSRVQAHQSPLDS